ncbi:hypothetical protein ACM46_11185 [Chryseobacterium angstadtii]|uniref:Transporter n=1 Tax=Chryseobacterium angstadtii TaxID=558151 RepID=A0A0J7IFR0_9FLAO|nr:transporter [Chryseobacterium angstadtii]KMQ64786.1 hypothetical protein ACM46_11185 [Chryseobacterium angstadtii]
MKLAIVKIRQRIIILFLNSGFLIIHAQKLNPIQLDRPDQTETVCTVPKAYLQVENGFRLEHITKKENRYEFPSVLWKYGLTNTIELRFITELAKENEEVKIRPVSVGFKTQLIEERGIIPKTSLIAHVMVQINKNAQLFTPRFRFTFQNNLSKKASIGYNLGMEWNPENTIPTYIYTLTYGRSLNEYLGAYIETYGFYSQNKKADSRINGGLTYLMSSNFMIDLSSGFGLSKSSPKYFIALGVSFRTKLKRK